MDLANVVFAGDGEVSSLDNGPIDVFAPVLAHLFFVDDPEKLGHELRIDCQQFDQSIPNGEDLVSHNFDIAGDQSRDSLRVSLARLQPALQSYHGRGLLRAH